MILVLDNFDSFTYNLVDYFAQLGIDCSIYRNDSSLADIKKEQFKGIVLSPGPGTPSTSGIMMEVLREYYNELPILGICLGHQALGEFFGAKLVKAQVPMHGKVSEIICTQDSIFNNLPDKFNVVRYHSLLINEVPKTFKVLAYSEKGEIMALKHLSLPLYGFQFHPEAILTEYGMELLKNWLVINQITD